MAVYLNKHWVMGAEILLPQQEIHPQDEDLQNRTAFTVTNAAKWDTTQMSVLITEVQSLQDNDCTLHVSLSTTMTNRLLIQMSNHKNTRSTQYNCVLCHQWTHTKVTTSLWITSSSKRFPQMKKTRRTQLSS